ncbi:MULTISPECIES: PDR/VanB family oxidoreductase [Pseudomonadaceae]|uniref:PDR/VanB family oxidoreductase n=1 Tax=Pseudomonadaceae TaxID=135621 RepID=UPI00187A29C3|nr:PDR/VanB family oxidoreductase [Pseudomonas lopnurensis]MBE7376675.1 oxidoreductase [Pseudomonas lopnurensis]
MSGFDMRVCALREEARDVLGVELAPADGVPLPFDWAPGAHVDLRLPNGLVRQYSLVSRPADGHLYFAVKREPGSRGGSRWLHEDLRLGQILGVGEPRNLFELHEGSGEVLLIAGGIGITPLLAMYRACRANARPVGLHYFARERAGLAFRRELEEQADVHLHVGLERAALHDRLGELLSMRGERASLYCCGPAGFMQRVREVALAAGWPEKALHQEHFQAQAEPVTTTGFELVLAASGRQVRVIAGESVAAAAARAGVEIPLSCGMGMCGCCLTRVIEGQPVHRDAYLGAAEQASGEWMLPCVSGCAGARLVLDC